MCFTFVSFTRIKYKSVPIGHSVTTSENQTKMDTVITQSPMGYLCRSQDDDFSSRTVRGYKKAMVYVFMGFYS